MALVVSLPDSSGSVVGLSWFPAGAVARDPDQAAARISLAVIIFSSIGAISGHGFSGDHALHWVSASSSGIGGVVGAPIGARIASRISQRASTVIFQVTLVPSPSASCGRSPRSGMRQPRRQAGDVADGNRDIRMTVKIGSRQRTRN